ncbi:MAG: hydrogenase small subunit [Thermodesulfobacteriota bacterium]
MLNRRQFLKMAATLSAAFGFTNFPQPVAAGLKKIDPDKIPKLLYLQGQSCSGCSVSLLQSSSPSAAVMITDFSKLLFHADLSAISGPRAIRLIDDCVAGKAGEYFLALEGAIPDSMPEACVIGDKTLHNYLEEAAETMSGAVAVGTCASFGGIPAAEGNPTGAVGLPEFYGKRNIDKFLVTIPGCSVHPDWVWHTITHLVKVGLPSLNENKSPDLFFNKTVHERCTRYQYFQEEIFASKPSDEGCLFKLGCQGPVTLADCPSRWWNGQTWCVDAGAPCIGCASPDFARKKNFPFYML